MRFLRFSAVAGLILLSLVPAVSGNKVSGHPEHRSDIHELQEMIRSIDEVLESREQRIQELNAKVSAKRIQLDNLEEELSGCEDRFKENIHLFGSRVRSAYLSGGSYFNVLLKADNLGDLIIRALYLRKVLHRDSGLITSIKEERAFIQGQKVKIEDKYHELKDLQYQARMEYNNLVAQRKEKEEMLREASTRLARRKPVYGIVIDNHPRARPQSGLAEAATVYEYEVEGRTTRYLALYSVFPSKVGPIRSARTHSIILAMENDVRYITASGSSDVLATIREWGLRYTNALFFGSFSFYRDPARYAPHNLYVNLYTLNLEQQSSELLIRPAFLARKGSPGTTVSLQYSSYLRIQYRYVPDLGAYERYINDQLYRDAGGANILVSNVIIQYTPHGVDFRSRPTPDLVGSGSIDFYCQGQYFRGTWKKDSIYAPTRFYYEDGQEIELIGGQTWIQIMRG